MFEKILFDLDGTLTDPKEGITKCFQHALRHFGIEEECDNLTKVIGPPLIDSFMEFYGLSKEQAMEGARVYRERFAPIGKFENELYEGIPKMLAKLKEKGIILGVASSKPEPFVRDILEHFEIIEYFDIIVGSLMNETRTKKEEVMQEALRQLGASVDIPDISEGLHNASSSQDGSQNNYKDQIAMVGDRKFDVISANSFGLASIGVRFGYAQPGELEASNPDYIAETVEDLTNYLLG